MLLSVCCSPSWTTRLDFNPHLAPPVWRGGVNNRYRVRQATVQSATRRSDELDVPSSTAHACYCLLLGCVDSPPHYRLPRELPTSSRIYVYRIGSMLHSPWTDSSTTALPTSSRQGSNSLGPALKNVSTTEVVKGALGQILSILCRVWRACLQPRSFLAFSKQR